jgi:hypothetical protein
MELCLLVIYAPPALEESLVDWLLENETVAGFSTTEVYGHGQRQTGMSLLEQVTGRQRRVQFSIEAGRETALKLVAGLKLKFKGAGLHYQLMPVLEVGRD